MESGVFAREILIYTGFPFSKSSIHFNAEFRQNPGGGFGFCPYG
jgi:hypothetical protein